MNDSQYSAADDDRESSSTPRTPNSLFDYEKYLNRENTATAVNGANNVNKLTKNAANNYNSNNTSTALVSESFRCYLENKQSNNSQAIAGAMKALQGKIRQLEGENLVLKDCF